MLVLGLVIPDEAILGVVGFVVEYCFNSSSGSIKRRKRYYDLGEAVNRFKRGVEFIRESSYCEQVTLYYYHEDNRLHRIKSYDTCNGLIEFGEQS